jgi:hypothetical protein
VHRHQHPAAAAAVASSKQQARPSLAAAATFAFHFISDATFAFDFAPLLFTTASSKQQAAASRAICPAAAASSSSSRRQQTQPLFLLPLRLLPPLRYALGDFWAFALPLLLATGHKAQKAKGKEKVRPFCLSCLCNPCLLPRR